MERNMKYGIDWFETGKSHIWRRLTQDMIEREI